MSEKMEAEERECLAPDDYDIGLMKYGGMLGCPCCGKTAVTFSRFFAHSGMYQAYVHCAHCDVQVFKNARNHDEARQLAKDAWSNRRTPSTAALEARVKVLEEALGEIAAEADKAGSDAGLNLAAIIAEAALGNKETDCEDR